MFQDAWRYRRIVLLLPLHDQEKDAQHPKHDEQDDDVDIGPVVLQTSPLKSEDETDDCRYEQDRSRKIKPGEFLLPGQPRKLAVVGRLEEGEQKQNGEGADREIDIETPTPAQMVCEDASE